MKKLFVLFILLVYLFTLPMVPIAISEEELPPEQEETLEERPNEETEAFPSGATLTLIPPKKRIYFTGEQPDYTGGSLIYDDSEKLTLPMDGYCTWPDLTTPGNKTVRASVNGLFAFFSITVLSREELIKSITDISPAHWSYSYFAACMKAGYFTGDDLHHLNPDAPITRAEMAQIIYRAWKEDPTVMEVHAEDAALPFADVPETEWYFEAVDACRKAGIIRGMEFGLFRPEEPILRQDAILMLMRIRYTDEELEGVDIEREIVESSLDPIDFRDVSDYARTAMALALGDLIFGNQDGTILPQSSITRAEAAAIFQRLFLKDYQWQAPTAPQPDLPSLPSQKPEEDEDKTPLIYLSPSNQFHNSYAAGKTTEGEQMTIVAKEVKRLLLKKGYRVSLAERERSIVDRPVDAAALGADVYVPIHSNAGGNKVGTYVFYNGAIDGSKELSREIFDRVAALTKTSYSTQRHKEDYLSLLPDGAPFKEVMYPTMPLAYIEVEFHDKPTQAKWIINHTDDLAEAIANGIVAYCEKHLLK